MTEIGGSHAQRDLFGQLLLDAHLKAWQLGDRASRCWRCGGPGIRTGVPVNAALRLVNERLDLAA